MTSTETQAFPSVDLLHMASERLREVYAPEGVPIWVNAPNKQLGGKTPFEVINEAQRLFDLIESLGGMVAT